MVATWTFYCPPEEMSEDQLRDELVDILFSCASDTEIDLNALDWVLDRLEKKYPLPQGIPTAEGSLSIFHKKYSYLFHRLEEPAKETDR